jgi:hypothetical protein
MVVCIEATDVLTLVALIVLLPTMTIRNDERGPCRNGRLSASMRYPSLNSRRGWM